MAWKAYLNVANGRQPIVITNRELNRPYHPIWNFDGDVDLDQIEDLEANMHQNGQHEAVFDDKCLDELKRLGLDQMKTIKPTTIKE